MDVIGYLREKGIRRAFQVIYQYKINLVLRKIMAPLLRSRALEDAIMIESHNDFDCNGGAFYDYLLENGYNKKYKIVWALKNQIPKELPQNVTAVPLFKPSIRYIYYNCVCKWLIADNQITRKVRPDQLCVFLDHGAFALKSCKGLYDIPSEVDYVLCPSEFLDEYKIKDAGLENPTKRLIHTGIPSDDIYFKDIPDEYDKITDKKWKHRILWMPTFRKGGGYLRNDSTAELPLGIPLVETEEMLEELNSFLQEKEALLVIKIHPMQDLSTVEKLQGKSNIMVLNAKTVKELGVDNYRLMKFSDALLSDYSSSAYSFLVLNRPLGFVMTDLKDYKRGMSVDNVEDYLVGDKIMTYADLTRFIRNLVEGHDEYKEQRTELLNKLYTHHDGNSCQRLAEFMGMTME